MTLAPPIDAAPAAGLLADAADFKRGMRRLASGVSIVATLHEGVRHGLVATAVASLAAEPPSLVVCVNRAASAERAFRGSGRLAVNVLAATHADLAAQFGTPARRAERFGSGRWTTLATGAPVLDDALAAFDCTVARVIDDATHAILIARVVAVHRPGAAPPAPLDPLVYFDAGFAGLAR